MDRTIRWIAILPASMAIVALSEIILNIFFTFLNWLLSFLPLLRFLYVEDVRTSIVHNACVGLGASYFSCIISIAIAPSYKKIVGVVNSSFFAVVYLLASLLYSSEIWWQFAGSLIVITIMAARDEDGEDDYDDYGDESNIWKKIRNSVIGLAAVLLLLWCGRHQFYHEVEHRPRMSPKSTKFDTIVLLKKYENNIFSFLYPNDWEIEEYKENGQIEILCTELLPDSMAGFDCWGVALSKTTATAEDVLIETISTMKASINYTIIWGNTYESHFNERISVCVDYEGYYDEDDGDFMSYNRLTVFKVGNYCVALAKRAMGKSDLDTRFKIMEDSFSVGMNKKRIR
jgi:hypothetical protein